MANRSLISLVLLLLAACSGQDGGKIPDPASAPDPVAPGAATAPTPGASDDGPSKPSYVRLTVNVDGAGRVTSSPPGIDCPGACAASFAIGAKVTLVAAPAEGWKLGAWKGDCSGASCTVTPTRDANVTSSLVLLDPRWDPSVGVADCASAWGTAGEKLSPCDVQKDDYVVVHKSKRNVALCKNGKLVKNMKSGLGFAPIGDKVKEGDGKTPEGVFYVPRLVPDSSYYKAFLLSYPSIDDAKRGAQAGLITNNQRLVIENAHAACVEPPQDTALGGDVEIHGNGSKTDWTLGCVAVDDASVDTLWSAIGVGDSIVILP